MRLLFLLLPLFCLSCGVKAPPVAPERPPEPAVQRLDCSPQDPGCDRTDPNYRPRSR